MVDAIGVASARRVKNDGRAGHCDRSVVGFLLVAAESRQGEERPVVTMRLDQLTRRMNDPERPRTGETPHRNFEAMECVRFASRQRFTFTLSKTMYANARILAATTMSEK